MEILSLTVKVTLHHYHYNLLPTIQIAPDDVKSPSTLMCRLCRFPGSSRGLFHQAIAMSAVWREMPALHLLKKPTDYTTVLANGLGFDKQKSSSETIKCLQPTHPKDILE